MGLLRDGPAGLRWGCRLGASGIPALHKLLLITKQLPTSAKKKKNWLVFPHGEERHHHGWWVLSLRLRHRVASFLGGRKAMEMRPSEWRCRVSASGGALSPDGNVIVCALVMDTKHCCKLASASL